jgi:hypothetical protein
VVYVIRNDGVTVRVLFAAPVLFKSLWVHQRAMHA